MLLCQTSCASELLFLWWSITEAMLQLCVCVLVSASSLITNYSCTYLCMREKSVQYLYKVIFLAEQICVSDH